ncbi:hypothetical protein [Acetobacter oeni]|uniref:Uncharacterized protein n=2 Tax=Acetobacter oeni TaxID=304077 RepID=A0A511XFR8_9PROT|nr:hypothetical protein [Acetobacter oeni]NHO18054.1 hypothetical protein [Acetobacter oeni]GEN61778.1 hypothetical protein AOE01nite_00020 [Acetobacter oeni]
MSEEDWTTQSPESAEADEEADRIDRAAGIPEPRQTSGSFVMSIVVPVIIGGIVLIGAFWWGAGQLGLFD